MKEPVVVKIEEELLSFCQQLGGIAEMNGPSTLSFAYWLSRKRRGIAIGDMTLNELCAAQDEWKRNRPRTLGEILAEPDAA